MTCFVLGCVRLNLANYHVHRNPFASMCTEWSPRLWFGDCIFLRCMINSMLSWCITPFLVLATVELFERAGTEGFWTCLSKHEWSGMWWKLTLFPKLRRASMVFLYGTLSKPEWTGWRWKLIVFCRTSTRFQTQRKLHNYVHWNSQCNTNVTLDWICIY